MDVKQKKIKSERPTAFTQPTPKPSQKPVVQVPAEQATPRFTLPRKKILLAAVILILIIMAWLANSAEDKPHPVLQGPSYTTILPKGESVVTLGGWKRVSPPENEPVYAYSDKVGDVPIIVSEQPMPKAFGRNSDAQVKKLAQSYNATDKITTGDIDVYIGTSSKGPQSVILAKEDLLILIKSERNVSNDAWKEYVDSLTSANLPNIPKY